MELHSLIQDSFEYIQDETLPGVNNLLFKWHFKNIIVFVDVIICSYIQVHILVMCLSDIICLSIYMHLQNREGMYEISNSLTLWHNLHNCGAKPTSLISGRGTLAFNVNLASDPSDTSVMFIQILFQRKVTGCVNHSQTFLFLLHSKMVVKSYLCVLLDLWPVLAMWHLRSLMLKLLSCCEIV